ncbi:PTPRM phosphatase, partial [Eudromia elegans]|nr:PTPRM phosphatase [Eudromia elegans]
TCQRPQWDPWLQLTPNQRNYRQNDEVMLSCPQGLHPSVTEVKCASEIKSITHGKPVYGEVWMRRNGTAGWIRIRSDVECTELLQVVAGTLEVSATSIKLNWTCRFPDACQHTRATCRLAWPSSPPCEAEEVTGEEMLQGQKGTFACPLLQPFTVYTVTISLPPSTVLYTRLVKTRETVPDKPQNLSLDASTGLLRWSALPSCKGEILAYQLSITARSARDSSFLEIERLQVNGSVTEYALPEHRPGRTYVVTVQGVTAAGAGDASHGEFPGSGLETSAPLDGSSGGTPDISPSQGTAVLALRPLAPPHAAQREHQLVVAASWDAAALAAVCSAELPPFNGSRQHRAYVAAVLNLTAPAHFVLGDGTLRHGYYNAPLPPHGNYTVLLRLVRRGQQAEKFTCVCYSVST